MAFLYLYLKMVLLKRVSKRDLIWNYQQIIKNYNKTINESKKAIDSNATAKSKQQQKFMGIVEQYKR